MGITIIENQAVKFNKQQSCVCWEKSYCQLVNNNDETQFEIKSSQVVPNADFESGFDDWNLIDEIVVSAYPVNTTEGVCEGEIDATATGGNGGPYEYSIDGINFSSSGLFEDLCEGEYTIIARDTDGNEGSATFEIFVNTNCGDYECSTLQDLIDSDLPLGAFLNCQLLDFLCQETGAAKNSGEVYFNKVTSIVYNEYEIGEKVPIKLSNGDYIEPVLYHKTIDFIGPYFYFSPAIVGSNQAVKVYY